MAVRRRPLLVAVVCVSILAGLSVAGWSSRSPAGHPVNAAIVFAGLDASSPVATVQPTDNGLRSRAGIRLATFVVALLVGAAARTRRRRGPTLCGGRISIGWKAGAASVRGPPVVLV